MKHCDRLICVTTSVLPALFIWLSVRRYGGFELFMLDCIEGSQTFFPTPVSRFVYGTIRHWHWLAVLGWILVVPAMLEKAWSRRLRIVMICVFCVLGPLLYGVCLQGLSDSQMRILEIDRSIFQNLRDHQTSDRSRQHPAGGEVQ